MIIEYNGIPCLVIKTIKAKWHEESLERLTYLCLKGESLVYLIRNIPNEGFDTWHLVHESTFKKYYIITDNTEFYK